MTIRAALADDIEPVVALWHLCGLTRPWNDARADFKLALGDDASTVFVAEGCRASVMVGFDGHRGWIYYFAVHPDHRRAGLGRSLMAEAEAWLQARGAPKLQLMVRDDNREALGFYAALGLEMQSVVVLGRRLDSPVR